MQKTGWHKLRADMTMRENLTCRFCGEAATTRVTFEDRFSMLKVNLCDDCAEKDYAELMLQLWFKWPE